MSYKNDILLVFFKTKSTYFVNINRVFSDVFFLLVINKVFFLILISYEPLKIDRRNPLFLTKFEFIYNFFWYINFRLKF